MESPDQSTFSEPFRMGMGTTISVALSKVPKKKMLVFYFIEGLEI